MFFYDSSMKVSKNLDSLFHAITACSPSAWKIDPGPSNLWTHMPGSDPWGNPTQSL